MFTVMTLNLNYYRDPYGPWELRKELIRSAIQAEQPDVIALQAVCRDPIVAGGQDQAAQLASLLPGDLQVYFQPEMGALHEEAGGSALLARQPWREVSARKLTLLPGLEDKNRRVLISAVFERGDRRLTLFNGHFSWVFEQGRINILEALSYMNSYDGPAMLVGDLNLTPDSDLWGPLREAGWVDVWAALHPEQEGFTFRDDGRLVKRIDYGWVNAELRPLVRDIRIVADERHPSGAWASDHAGLLITLDL